MSEEQNTQDSNDGTWSGLKKTIIGLVGTVATAGGVWVSTTLFGGHDKEETKTEQVAPAPVVVNVQQSQAQVAPAAGGHTTIIKERVVEKAAAAAPKAEKPAKKSETEDAPW